MGGAIDRFHRGVCQERHFVDSFDFVCSGSMSLVEVAVIADNGSRLGSEPQHFFAGADGSFGGGRRFVPFDLEKLAGFDGGPGGISDHGDARTGVVAVAGAGRIAELMGEVSRLHFKNSADVRSGFHLVGVEAQRRAALNGATFHGGDEHSRKPRVQTELSVPVALASESARRVGLPMSVKSEGFFNGGSAVC